MWRHSFAFINVPLNSPTISRYCYHDIRRVDLAAFHSDIQQLPLYDFHSATSVDSYVELFNNEVERILDKHTPLKSRTRRVGRHDCRWLSADVREAKRRCCRRECRYRKTHSSADKLGFQAAREAARDAITRSRSDAIRQRFDDVTGNSAATWRALCDVLHRDHRPVYSDSQCRTLSCGFSQYFTDKLECIHQSIATRRWRSRRCTPQRQRNWMTWSRQLFQFVLCGNPTPSCWTSQERELSSHVGLFQSRLRTLGTHYHPTLNRTVDTFKTHLFRQP